MSEILVNPKKEILTGKDAQASTLAHDCLVALNREYPKHPWRVGLSPDLSMVYIINMDIHDQYGYRLRTTRVQEDPSKKCVIKAGGEILERAFMIRGMMRHEPEKLDLRHATKDIRATDLETKMTRATLR